MLASKPYQAPLGGPSSHASSSYHSASSHKTTTVPSSNNSSRLTSPTGSVFSDSLDELDSVRCAWPLARLGGVHELTTADPDPGMRRRLPTGCTASNVASMRVSSEVPSSLSNSKLCESGV